MQRIEEVEDFIVTPEEVALVADLNQLVEEIKEKEQKANEEKRARK